MCQKIEEIKNAKSYTAVCQDGDAVINDDGMCVLSEKTLEPTNRRSAFCVEGVS